MGGRAYSEISIGQVLANLLIPNTKQGHFFKYTDIVAPFSQAWMIMRIGQYRKLCQKLNIDDPAGVLFQMKLARLLLPLTGCLLYTSPSPRDS